MDECDLSNLASVETDNHILQENALMGCGAVQKQIFEGQIRVGHV